MWLLRQVNWCLTGQVNCACLSIEFLYNLLNERIKHRSNPIILQWKNRLDGLFIRLFPHRIIRRAMKKNWQRKKNGKYRTMLEWWQTLFQIFRFSWYSSPHFPLFFFFFCEWLNRKIKNCCCLTKVSPHFNWLNKIAFLLLCNSKRIQKRIKKKKMVIVPFFCLYQRFHATITNFWLSIMPNWEK